MDIVQVNHLSQVLEGHLVRYQRLVDYIIAEKNYLLDMDLEKLLASAQEKEALGLDIQNNIAILIDAINNLALQCGLPLEPQPLLVDLVPYLPKPFANKINDGAIKLAHLKNIIQRENEAQRYFIEEAQRLVTESINILTGANQLKGDGYKKDGRQGEKKITRPVKFSREV